MAEFQFFKSGEVIEIRRFQNNTSFKNEPFFESGGIEENTFFDESEADRVEENRSYNLNASKNDIQRMAREYFNEESFFVTLTFREQYGSDDVSITDNLFKKFIMRLRYKHERVNYLAVRELTKKGRVHYHFLLNDKYLAERWAVENIQEKQSKMGFRYDKHKDKQVQIKCEERKKYENELADIWTHGFCDMMQMGADNDNFGAYISKYMTKDLDLFRGHKSYLSSREVKKIKPLKFASFEDVPDVFKDVLANFDDYIQLAHKVAQNAKKEAFTSTYYNEYQGQIDFLELNLRRLEESSFELER